MVDVYPECECFVGEEEFVADGGEEEVGVLCELFWLYLLGRGISETSLVLFEVEMEGSRVLIRFDNLVFMIVDPAFHAFAVLGEPV